MKNNSKSRKKRLGSYPYVSVIFSISLALFMLGALGMLAIHGKKLTSIIQENVEMQVFLNKNVTEAQRIKIRKVLEGYEFIAREEDQQARIDFLSKEEGAETFIAETGEDFVNFLGENPLRDEFIIHIDREHQTEAKMAEIAQTINGISGVFEVEYVETLVNTINQNVTKIVFVLGGFSIILIAVVIVLINNTIKLALFSQRFLIRSMQLVGAKRSFIRRPFLLRSLMHGIVSALIASALLFMLAEYAYSEVEELMLLKDNNLMILLVGILVLLGATLGFFSSLRSVNKYLKLSLDELY
ncbi:MAG: permease-like cell division protein FtsX [Bacteroidota bacterium]